MNFEFYLEKLKGSHEFKKFIKENKDAFLCSGFFIIDKKGEEGRQNLDYFIPSSKKMFSFKLNEGVELVPVENFGDEVEFEKIPDKINLDFEEIEKLIEGKMFDEKIKNKIEKILLSLQTRKGKNYLLGTVFISGLGLIKIKVDLDNKEILDFEKRSFFDMMKIIKKGD